MKAVEFNNVTKTYFGKKALNQLSFSIEDNTITGLVGRNGAGKTTLMKIAAGYLKPSSGTAKVFSENPFESLHVSLNSIFVDDGMVFPSALPLGEILQEGARFYPNWNDRLARRLLDYFSLDPKNYHNRLSKGKTSIFNAIVGLASRCPLTMFDEPTTGMDEAARKDFYRALLKDYLDHPRTIILSSHHLEEIEDLLENILLIQGGQNFLHLPMSEFSSWAIAVRGSVEVVRDILDGREIIYEKTLGKNTIQAVVRNELTKNEVSDLRGTGAELFPVSSSDLFVYLTNKEKGGIDDVFNENESR
ncbi:ABC transporter ATP-binding protein [Neobacillus notoginsengisoli]|uniref:ABC transporter ATP-binding protein n=1 Tax=Neobacillus notoginsengisoli TaxID=1578198 RepID=A0A417YQ76_9BACI|nr:ABC transporter ATP-binding protein [Neobacillus notoginsengisoli]RHW35713.1 ABC transporter ATP-binding protein [Neobacillus notoginsengisoli]